MRLLCLVTVLLWGSVVRAEDWQVRGRVVDEAGRPVAGATVAYFWSANGTGKRADGTPLDVTKDDELRELWAHEGEMQPRGRSATTAEDGSFVTTLHGRAHAVMAMDAGRKRGGIVRVAEGKEEAPVAITLGPLVRVRGKFASKAGEKAPVWTNVYVLLPADATRPIDSLRVAHCASFDARFELWLPPGKYVLDAYAESNSVNEIDLRVEPDREIVVSVDSPEHDVGVLELQSTASERQKRVIELKTAGKWGDYTKEYGKSPPPWNVVDARGVKKDVRLSDFRGKWVLIDFWGFSCPACLGTDLPALMKFYDEYAAERDRFEILAFCIDSENDLKSLVDVDRLLVPIVAHVWKGRTLPFPQLLDPSFTTAQRYGLRGYGAKLLIDPEGNLVEGDENTLAERLKR